MTIAEKNHYQPKTYQSVPMTAKQLGVSTKTVREWIAEGKLTAYRPSPRVIRLDAEEVDQMMLKFASDRW